MGLLDHKRAFITGGGSGIGAATARRFAAEGAAVAVADINRDNARAVADEIGGEAYAVDVTDFTALAAAVRDADESLGGLTTLFNNAGGSTLAPIHKYDEAKDNRAKEAARKEVQDALDALRRARRAAGLDDK